MQEKTSFWQRYGLMILTIILYGLDLGAVSYTHLDVYKRQILYQFHEFADQRFFGISKIQPGSNGFFQ